MAGEWQKTTLGKIASRGGYGLVDGPFGSNLPASLYRAAGVPVVRGSNLSLGTSRFRIDEFVFVSEETADSLERSICRPDDIIFTKKGTLGQTGLIPRDGNFERYLLSSNQMKLTVDRSIADPLFVYYQVSSPESVAKIMRDAESTGVPKTNVAYLREFPICLPALEEQRAIAHVLGALDDKIELNRRRNQTLEAMARALFKDWFVDFGPVRAKMEGREPYLPADLWQLFPDRIEEQGKPMGWETKRISDFMSLAYGRSLPAGSRLPGSVPVYGSGGITGFHSEALVDGPAAIIGRKGTVGSLYWEDRACFPIDTVFYVQPKAPLCFSYYLLESLPLRDMNTDAAVPGLNRENVYRLEVAAPPAALIEGFSKTASYLRKTIAAVAGESETLAHLRDTLLPKLISGELRIADAEKFIERAGARDHMEVTAT